MSGFRFKLDPVLRQREAIERDAQRLVADRLRDRIRIQQELELLRTLDEEERRDLTSRLGSGGGAVQAGELTQQSAASVHASRRIREAALRATGAEQRLDEARAVLTRATARRRAIELMREQQIAEWKARRDRAEALELDDIAMSMRRLSAGQQGGAA